MLEYKSLDGGMGIDDFYKAMRYAALYKCMSGRENGRPAGEITFTLVREAYSREMMRQLEKEGYRIVLGEKGIYGVQGAPFYCCKK